MKPIGVCRFPGTNCDRDVWSAIESVQRKPQWLWHADNFQWKDFSAIVIPGGFSYGDYLRSGALAAIAPAMKSVSEAASHGVPILGICNGFQILCELRLLPGVLMKNASGRFINEWLDLKIESHSKSVRMPIAHGDGRWFADQETVRLVEDNGEVWVRYLKNPNGSLNDIAGLKRKNIMALMPHPDRAMHEWMGSTDGREFFEL